MVSAEGVQEEMESSVAHKGCLVHRLLEDNGAGARVKVQGYNDLKKTRLIRAERS